MFHLMTNPFVQVQQTNQPFYFIKLLKMIFLHRNYGFVMDIELVIFLKLLCIDSTKAWRDQCLQVTIDSFRWININKNR